MIIKKRGNSQLFGEITIRASPPIYIFVYYNNKKNLESQLTVVYWIYKLTEKVQCTTFCWTKPFHEVSIAYRLTFEF